MVLAPETTVRPVAALAAEASEVAVAVAPGAMVETVDLAVVRVGFSQEYPCWGEGPCGFFPFALTQIYFPV